jgi:hypothetical protein
MTQKNKGKIIKWQNDGLKKVNDFALKSICL